MTEAALRNRNDMQWTDVGVGAIITGALGGLGVLYRERIAGQVGKHAADQTLNIRILDFEEKVRGELKSRVDKLETDLQTERIERLAESERHGMSIRKVE